MTDADARRWAFEQAERAMLGVRQSGIAKSAEGRLVRLARAADPLAQWLLTGRLPRSEDALLVEFDDVVSADSGSDKAAEKAQDQGEISQASAPARQPRLTRSPEGNSDE